MGHEQTKPEFQTSYNHKREERIYDPILTKFRDGHQETAFTRMEKAQSSHSRVEGERRAADHNQTFNIISNKAQTNKAQKKLAKEMSKSSLSKTRVPDSHTPWNIVSNKNFPEESVQFDALKHTDTMQAWTKKQATLNHPETIAHRAPGTQEHDFSIVTNKYTDQHEDKQRMDSEAALKLAASKFWQTHDFNVVTGKFYDPQKESNYLSTSKDVSQQTASMAE